MRRERPLWLLMVGIVSLLSPMRDYFGPPDLRHPRSRP
jgi:hypothetical protein